MKEKVVLLQCGSFNPVTIMHLRMMEIAKDHLHQCGYVVKGGFISPVHDAYPKDSLISITHRSAMLKFSLESSDWLQLSSWESEQKGWTKTYDVLQYHQKSVNSSANTRNINSFSSPNKIDINANNEQIIVKLIGGADFLASFNVPGLWSPFHMEEILKRHGLVIITRSGYNITEIIDNNDILFRYMNKIIVVNEYIENSISSTRIRKACSRGQSIKYLVCDGVERYIKTHKLYSYSNMNKYEKDKTEIATVSANVINQFINKPTNTKIKSVIRSKNKRQKKVSCKKKNLEEVRVSSRLKKKIEK